MKKVTTKNGVISNDSTIIVAPGQCAIIYDNGRIIDATAEENGRSKQVDKYKYL